MSISGYVVGVQKMVRQVRPHVISEVEHEISVHIGKYDFCIIHLFILHISLFVVDVKKKLIKSGYILCKYKKVQP